MKHKITGGLFAVAVFFLNVLPPAGAQNILTPLHNFTGLVFATSTNTDGAEPFAGLIASGGSLYGTANVGGTNGSGMVFAISTNGAGFTNLHSFTTRAGSNSTNRDGALPNAGLILSGGTLFGTAPYGGTNGNGALFAVGTNGAGFATLHSFTVTAGSSSTNKDGANPYAGLILSGNILFGTAQNGGTNGGGAIFSVLTNGTSFTNLHSFTTTAGPSLTNRDGASPHAGLVLFGKTLYGTAGSGGTNGNGAIFAVVTNGTSFINLHSFTATTGPSFTNSDGASPQAGLLLVGGTLFGTASSGGANGNGTVFSVNTNGTGFATLHSFTAMAGSINSDGALPQASLILSGNTLYGTTYSGGMNGRGAVFAVSTNGTNFATLYSFTATSAPSFTNNDGASPNASLLLLNNLLYGTTAQGGTSGQGNVFSVSSVPSLVAAFTPSVTNGVAPLTVIFTNLSVNATNYVWNFGDGNILNTASSTNVTDTYTNLNGGTYQVILTAVGLGVTNMATNSIVVQSAVSAPVAGFSGSPTAVFVTQPVVFTNTSTGNITNWSWNFGNGTFSTGAGTNVTDTYNTAGSNTVSLIVSGSGGSSTNTQANYIVVYPLPVIGSPVLSGHTNFIFSGTNGVPSAQYRIFTTTNVALPFASWVNVFTGAFDANGNYSYTNSPATNPANFFRLTSP
jgi:uncharacterized repeat protein (TIGR03803 family)